MAGKENLVDLRTRTTEEKRAIGIKGGTASGRARRRKKSMREWAELFGSLGIAVPAPDGSEIDTDLNGAAVMAQYQRASKGDTRAAQFIADLRGEMDKDVSLKVKDGVTIIVNSKEEQQKMKDIGKLDV